VASAGGPVRRPAWRRRLRAACADAQAAAQHFPAHRASPRRVIHLEDALRGRPGSGGPSGGSVDRAVGLAPYVSFVTEPLLLSGIVDAGFEVLETGMYPQKSRSLFIVARKAERAFPEAS
jgi:hypothetical protein